MSEEDYFILEAAEQYGFEEIEPPPYPASQSTTYRVSAEDLVRFIKAARERDREDVREERNV